MFSRCFVCLCRGFSSGSLLHTINLSSAHHLVVDSFICLLRVYFHLCFLFLVPRWRGRFWFGVRFSGWGGGGGGLFWGGCVGGFSFSGVVGGVFVGCFAFGGVRLAFGSWILSAVALLLLLGGGSLGLGGSCFLRGVIGGSVFS